MLWLFWVGLGCSKHGDMERKNTRQWWCLCWEKCGLYFHIMGLWAPEILPDPKHGVTRVVTRAHTADVESRVAVLQGWGPYPDSGGRGYLLLDYSLKTGCPHLTDRFLWRGYYHSRAYRSSLCSRDEDIGEKYTHQSNDGWAPTDRPIYYAQGG